MTDSRRLEELEKINPLIGPNVFETLSRVGSVFSVVQAVEDWRSMPGADPQVFDDRGYGWGLLMRCAEAALEKQAELLFAEQRMSQRTEGQSLTDAPPTTH